MTETLPVDARRIDRHRIDFATFALIAELAGLHAEECAPGCWELTGSGALDLAYFPDRGVVRLESARFPMEVSSAVQAVACALLPPPRIPRKCRIKEQGNASRRRRIKAALWLRGFRSCYWCGRVFENALSGSIEHVLPRSRGGRFAEPNAVLACSPCNTKRGDLMPELSPRWILTEGGAR